MLSIPKITYNGQELELTVPQRQWRPETLLHGGRRTMVSGAAAAWVQRQDERARIRVRFTGEEWTDVKEWLLWAQTNPGTPFVYQYDAEEADQAVDYVLEEPGVGAPLAPQPTESYGVWEIELLLRSPSGMGAPTGGGTVTPGPHATYMAAMANSGHVNYQHGFDATESTGEAPLTYAWTATTPGGMSAYGDGAFFSFVPDSVGIWTIQLVVTDRLGRTDIATGELEVETAPEIWSVLEEQTPGMVAMVYNHRYGVVETGDLVSEWQDARGSQHPWKLAGSGTARPLKTAEGLQFDGVDDALTFPTTAWGSVEAMWPYIAPGRHHCLWAVVVLKWDHNTPGSFDKSFGVRGAGGSVLETRRYLSGSNVAFYTTGYPSGASGRTASLPVNRAAASSFLKVHHMYVESTGYPGSFLTGNRIESGLDSNYSTNNAGATNGGISSPRQLETIGGATFKGTYAQILVLKKRPTPEQIALINQYAAEREGANPTWQ